MTRVVVCFDGVREWVAAGIAEHGCATRSNPRVSILILHIVITVLEVALQPVKIDRVQRHELRDHHGFHLHLWGIQLVTKDEAAAFRAMRVEVDVHLELATLRLLEYSFLGKEDGWVSVRHGVFVHPVQIESQRVEAPVASADAIWIQEWNDLEDVMVEQNLRLHVSKIAQLVHHTLQHIAGGRLTTMHSTRQKDHGPVLCHCLLGSECDHVNGSIFERARKLDLGKMDALLLSWAIVLLYFAFYFIK